MSTLFFFADRALAGAIRILYKSPKTSAVGPGRKGLRPGEGGWRGRYSGVEPPPDRPPVVTSRYNNCVLDGSAAARPRNFKTMRRRTRPEAHAQIPTTPPSLDITPSHNSPRKPTFLSGPSISHNIYVYAYERLHRCPHRITFFFFFSLFLYYYYFLSLLGSSYFSAPV